MSKQLTSKVIFAVRNGTELGFILVLGENLDVNKGFVIEQVDNQGNNEIDPIFEVTGETTIHKEQVLYRINIRCRDVGGKYLIPLQEYKNILNEISFDQGDFKEDDQDNQGSEDGNMDDVDDQLDYSDSENTPKKRRRRKGSEDDYHDYSDNDPGQQGRRKGRGRPKGSKNKKTLLKEQYAMGRQPNFDLRNALTGKIKRGKGRPPGSKNKPKDRLNSENTCKLQNQMSSQPFGKRGKGRPKGSKNKIRAIEPIPQMSNQQQIQKRGRGRPKGAKNKPHSTPSIEHSQRDKSEQIQKISIDRISPERFEDKYCCRRCLQYSLKRKLENHTLSLQEAIFDIKNISEDFGLEDKNNILLNVIKYGEEPVLLQKILEIVNETQVYFKPPWETDRIVEKTKYEVKTKKQYLSKTGKEGIHVLLHDSSKKKEVWWKQIGLERIIQYLPHKQPGKEILEILFSRYPELKKQLYACLPNVVRAGNSYIAGIIFRDMISPSNNINNYSQQHLQLLVGNASLIHQYKKFNLIKHNDGVNYCSPIHCAAICSNPTFLYQLLKLFKDVINIQDSILRKPVHYAAICENSENLKALIECGAELKQFDRRKITPLMLACSQGIIPNVQYILQKVRDPIYINYKSDQGFTALHYAILRNQTECVQILLNDAFIDIKAETKQGQDAFHLVAFTGNVDILRRLLEKGATPTTVDRYKRSPAMFAIRNRHSDILYELLEQGGKYIKPDSSGNTLLHYAAAYGNLEAILVLKKELKEEQVKNKRNYYPWQIAIMKGHKGCAQLLELDNYDLDQDPMYLILSNIRGTKEYLSIVKYILETVKTIDINYQEKLTGNGYLHQVCNIGQDQYQRIRKQESSMSSQEIKQEFVFVQSQLIDFFLSKGLDGNMENRKKQSLLKLCIENSNLIGFRKLLTSKINFDLESSYGTTIMHCLSNLACTGLQEMQFVHSKLLESDINDLRINLKKTDHNGFDFLLYFVKNFTQTIKVNFKRSVKKKISQGLHTVEAEKSSFKEFLKLENKFISLITYLMEMGCDINGQVIDKRAQTSEKYKKWGVQHFLMMFPSLKLIEFFKSKIRDFNAQNNQNRTPLHLFCINVVRGNLLETQIQLPKEYQAQHILQYLLANGLNPVSLDIHRSYPILYAALNHQYSFITMLKKYKSPINVCNNKNQVPFIQIIKNSKHYNLEQIKTFLKNDADPNFQDMDKRNSLHHLVYHSTNFDTSPQVCKLLFDFGVKVNALDKYKRSPIFYCFTKIDNEENTTPAITTAQEPNDKVQILQVLLNHKDINLNLLDVFHRSLVHYACEKDYFFSILYLLDRNINIQIGDYEQNTPLGVCLKYRNLNQAALLIKKGVKYGYVHDGNQKQSYFMYAMNNLSVGICFMLLDYGYPIQKALQEVTNEPFKKVLIQKYIKSK